MPLKSSLPVYASYPSDHLTIGAGVAIFHLATARVVLCQHSRDAYYFLPKGRRNASEPTKRGAEREGFEESGYRNRILPLPLSHRQPDPDEGRVANVCEPVWTQFLPLTSTKQYLLFWYVAETVPAEVEALYGGAQTAGEGRVYAPPPAYPEGLSLQERIEQDRNVNGKGGIYEPVWHEGTGVDEDELLYRSYLLPIEEAMAKLKGSVMEDVIRRGWQTIQLRMEQEKK